jgi:GDPmannose 4,6-dehydratase
VSRAAAALDISIEWRGAGVDEKGFDAGTGKCLVEVDPRYFRPSEVESLLGDASRAREELGWTPRITFDALVKEMMTEDMRLAERDALVRSKGFRHYNQNE